MENYLEQVVSNSPGSRKSLLYFLVCMLFLIFLMWALICFAGVITGAAGSFEISWVGVAGCVVFGGLALLCFRAKDALRTEYEYVYSDDKLDVSSVMNNKRRRYLTRIELDKVKLCGPAKGPAFDRINADKNYVRHKWYLDGQASLHYFVLEKRGAKHLMLLQLNNDMLEMIARSGKLPMGAWHDTEGKTAHYGSLS